MKVAIWLVVLLLLLSVVPVWGQDDPTPSVNVLLDAADSALADGDLSSAHSLLDSAAQLLTDTVVAECSGALAARTVLQEAALATEIADAQALLSAARTLLAPCGDIEAAPVTPIEVDPLAYQAVTTNRDWTPIIQAIEGVDMALVPVGCFMMGSDFRTDEQPIHQICFDAPFWIDAYEVTNAQFGSLSDDENCTQYSSQPDQPRNCVTWAEAAAFCETRGGRLPTEAEWEFAARGPDALNYPWGNEFVADNVVYYGTSNVGTSDDGSSRRVTAPVGSRPSGATWVGALDMSGNLYEWTNSLDMAYPYDATDGRESVESTGREDRVLRGGSFMSGTFEDNGHYNDMRASFRSQFTAGLTTNNIGFRCVVPTE